MPKRGQMHKEVGDGLEPVLDDVYHSGILIDDEVMKEMNGKVPGWLGFVERYFQNGRRMTDGEIAYFTTFYFTRYLPWCKRNNWEPAELSKRFKVRYEKWIQANRERENRKRERREKNCRAA